LRAMALATLLLPLSLAAQVHGSGEYLARMDSNHDGRVSLPEYQDWMGYAFAAMDRDHDGILAAAELPGGRGRPVTREAHRERLAAGFHRQDRNGDGQLDARELSAPPR
jgi:Ca2+-binding EF-hand superfamily protein